MSGESAPAAESTQDAARRLLGAAFEHQVNGRDSEAVEAYCDFLVRFPDWHMAYNNLAAALNKIGRPAEAVPYYSRSIAANPAAGTMLNLGRALRRLRRNREAETWVRSALRMEPATPDGHYLLGLILTDLARRREALACFDAALRLRPDFPDAALSRAGTLLALGDFEGGFRAYESRLDNPRVRPLRDDTPRWRGEDVNGRVILVRCEQGHGDSIQFARYLPLLKARGATVVVESQPALMRLFGGMAAIDAVVPYDAPIPDHDLWSPMLSLPMVFGTVPGTIPAQEAYLRPVHSIPLKRPNNRLLVGLCWQAGPNFEDNTRRSSGLRPLMRLFENTRVVFLTLQRGPGSEEIGALRCQGLIQGDANRLNDFADTAAIMAEMDLVITVDTGVAHLAGALGRPTWTLLSEVPDWRWGDTGEDCPWYPTMRLFRRAPGEDWEDPARRMAKALARLVEERLGPVALPGADKRP